MHATSFFSILYYSNSEIDFKNFILKQMYIGEGIWWLAYKDWKKHLDEHNDMNQQLNTLRFELNFF